MNGEYRIIIAKSAIKDKDRIAQYPSLKQNVNSILEIIRSNPFQNPPPYEKLLGNLSGFYSRRINRQHRLVYEVDTELKIVRIISMWTHYE